MAAEKRERGEREEVEVVVVLPPTAAEEREGGVGKVKGLQVEQGDCK